MACNVWVLVHLFRELIISFMKRLVKIFWWTHMGSLTRDVVNCGSNEGGPKITT